MDTLCLCPLIVHAGHGDAPRWWEGGSLSQAEWFPTAAPLGPRNSRPLEKADRKRQRHQPWLIRTRCGLRPMGVVTCGPGPGPEAGSCLGGTFSGWAQPGGKVPLTSLTPRSPASTGHMGTGGPCPRRARSTARDGVRVAAATGTLGEPQSLSLAGPWLRGPDSGRRRFIPSPAWRGLGLLFPKGTKHEGSGKARGRHPGREILTPCRRPPSAPCDLCVPWEEQSSLNPQYASAVTASTGTKKEGDESMGAFEGPEREFSG